MNLYPFQQVLDQVNDLLNDPTIDCYQQFKCAKCGMKQTMDVANTFYTSGKCEVCGSITDIKRDGHNFMMVKGPHKAPDDDMNFPTRDNSNTGG
jgi:hypothetical protein